MIICTEVIKWNADLSKAPTGERIMVRVNHGIFGGGKHCYFALKMGNDFFSAETKAPIQEVDAWCKFG